MAPTAVYEGDVTRSEPGADGQLFAGQKLWFSQSVPQRKWLIQNAENNGAIVVPLDKQADVILVDHARKNQAPGTFSYRYVEFSIRNGQLEDLQLHAVGSTSRVDRPVGSVRTIGKSTRAKFTEAEDQLLWDWVKPYAELGGSWKGNQIYKQLEAFNGNHTFQSWRDRWIKHTQFQKREVTKQIGPAYEDDEEENHTVVQDLLQTSADSTAQRAADTRSRKVAVQNRTDVAIREESLTPDAETTKSSQRLTPPGSGRNAVYNRQTDRRSTPVPRDDNRGPVLHSAAEILEMIAGGLELQTVPKSLGGSQESDAGGEAPWSSSFSTPADNDPLPPGYNFTQEQARKLYDGVPWIDGVVTPERRDKGWEKLAQELGPEIHTDVWQSYFYETILPEYRRRKHLQDTEAFVRHKDEEDNKYKAQRAQREAAEAKARAQSEVPAALAETGVVHQTLGPQQDRSAVNPNDVHGSIPEQADGLISCANCFTSTTRRWRKDIHGRRLCDQCGRFLKFNGIMRPSATWTEPFDQDDDDTPCAIDLPNHQSDARDIHDDEQVRRIALAGIEALERFSSSLIDPNAGKVLESLPPLSIHNLAKLEHGSSAGGSSTLQHQMQSNTPRSFQAEQSTNQDPGGAKYYVRSPKRNRADQDSDGIAKRLKPDIESPSNKHSTQASIISISSHGSDYEDDLTRASKIAGPSRLATLNLSSFACDRSPAWRTRNISQSPLFIPETFDQHTDESPELAAQNALRLDREQDESGSIMRKASPLLQLINDEENEFAAGGSSQYAPSETLSERDLFVYTQPELSQAWETAPQDVHVDDLPGEQVLDASLNTKQTDPQQSQIAASESSSEDSRWDASLESHHGFSKQSRRSEQDSTPISVSAVTEVQETNATNTHSSSIPDKGRSAPRISPSVASNPSWPPTDGEEEFESLLSQSNANGGHHKGADGGKSPLSDLTAKARVQTVPVNNRIDTQALFQQSMPDFNANDSYLIPPPEGGWDTDSDIDITFETAVEHKTDPHVKSEVTERHTQAHVSASQPRETLQDVNDSNDVDQYFTSQTRLYSGLAIEKSILQTMQVRALESTNLDTTLAARILSLMIKSYQNCKSTDPSFDIFEDAFPSASALFSRERKSASDRKAVRGRRKEHIRSVVDALIPNDMKGVWTNQDDTWLLGEDASKVQTLEKKHGGDGVDVRFEYLSAAFGD